MNKADVEIELYLGSFWSVRDFGILFGFDGRLRVMMGLSRSMWIFGLFR